MRVIACGMLAREILDIKRRHRLEHLELVCLPARYHYTPDRIVPAMEQAILAAKAEGITRIFAGYADCGTGGMLDRLLEKHGIARIEGPHCFAAYQGLKQFEAAAQSDMRSFYMTDFLCRHFDAFFLRPMGLDRHPELIADFFGHYERLVYLAQTDDQALERIAKDAARLLNLQYERRFTGYGDLVPALVQATGRGA